MMDNIIQNNLKLSKIPLCEISGSDFHKNPGLQHETHWRYEETSCVCVVL